MTHRNTWIGAFLITLGLLGLVTAKAHERTDTGPAAILDKTFAAETVSLNNIDAALRIDTYDGSVVRIKATGSRHALDRLRLSVKDGTLEIAQPATPRNSVNVVHVERNVVINRGGTSTVIIGGTPSAEVPGKTPLRLQVMLPRRLPLSVRAFSGKAEIGPLAAPLEFELMSGRVSAARLAGARLAIAGGGEIEVARADGPLRLDIDGNGQVAVRDGVVPTLSIDANGTASILIGGRVGTATLSLNGVADVAIDHVDREPEIDANGIAEVEFGNW
jgi:hypothetical protein